VQTGTPKHDVAVQQVPQKNISANASNNEIFLLIYCERSTRSHAFWNGFAILNLMPKVLAHR
jgi:hypothetical protein